MEICDVCGRTDKECRIRTIKGMKLCPKHVTQYYRHGKFLESTIYSPNEYIVHEGYAEIVLKNKEQMVVGKAVIDIEDIEKCKRHKWHMYVGANTKYARCTLSDGKVLHLHRYIMDYDGDMDVDHIDGNGLNNRKSNLRIVPHCVNSRNIHGCRTGVRKVPSGKVQATITKDYKTIYLGTFNTYEDAMFAKELAKSQYWS